MSSVIVDRLAGRYGVECTTSARRAHPSSDQDVLSINVPRDLVQAIAVAAAGHGRNWQDEVIWALCQDYGLDFEPARKRQGPKRLPAAA